MKAFMPPHFFVVATEFKELGFGSVGDIQPAFGDAYDQFVQMVSEGQPVAVYRIDTDDMESELRRIEAERGLKRSRVFRFHSVRQLAAE